MDTAEQAPASRHHDTQAGDVSGPAHAGPGGTVQIEQAELAATRAAAALRRVLSADEQTRACLLDARQHISALHAQLGEWIELHHILNALTAAFSPFYADLRALCDAEAGPSDGRALLRGWRPCQAGVDRLIDFEGGVAHVQLPRLRQRTAAPRSDWGARIAALRREMEDRLTEERWSAEGLIDLADEFNHACACYRGLAGRELRRVADSLKRLYTHLLGGLS